MSENYQHLLDRNLDLDELLSGTFNSILRVEEQALQNRFTEGLSITDVHTIVAVGMYERNPMNVAANRLGITLATLTSAVKKLEAQGFVRRERDEADRRKVLLSLTAHGRKVYRAHRIFHEEMLSAALSELDDREAKVLAEALSKLKEFFDSRA
ncbi:MAG: MarR family winged helix-turn-helix transcriptional regulator [Berryella intestinalis]|uniref:MarR family winged helix-turn-helix transcriptional regulator n=1 Tax=Berryella intestinalis TaxID=1531429 RepID=UPI002A766B81|nr:MarR family winged helix-turn-helix transcriptional regulator [Berryella intestinalis]MDY3129419.1 MarR family winged helix-turn-helix transcriptional regulator [Berryella intestinalis]